MKKAILNNGFYPEKPDNFIICFGEIEGVNCPFECEVGKHLAIVENGEIVEIDVWSEWRDSTWHEQTTYQIKLTLIDNTKMLQKYPDMAQYAKVLPCYIELDYVYLYVNFITDEDITRLNEFNAIINEHN